MQFTSLIFITCLMPIFFILAFFFREKPKARIFLVGIYDLIFYIWGGYKAFLLSIAVCLLTWIIQLIVIKWPKKAVTVIGCVVIAIPLVLSKYVEGFIVPMGISFYTFEAISLIADTYRDENRKRRSVFEILMYMFFFTTVSQGPIVRISCFEEGIRRNPSMDDYNEGIKRFAIGLGKKVLLADKIAPLADYYFKGIANGNSYSMFGLWMGSIAYTLQIYFDFSGYSDMAIGIAKTIGFNIPENFNMPYLATSIKDFWRRWHISLSSWFRDYIYISLGGNRKGEVRTVINLFIVWFLTGIWHGNDFTFIVWGLGYFVLLLIERYGGKAIAFLNKGIAGRIYTLFFVNLLWVFFRSENLSSSIDYLKGMAGVGAKGVPEAMALRYLPFLIILCILCLLFQRIRELYNDNKKVRIAGDACLVFIVVLSVCAIVNMSYTPFIYGKF